MDDDDGILSFDDAYNIGVKIAEMADRVKVGNKHTPGAQCKWVFEMDGTSYEVVVSVARAALSAAIGEDIGGGNAKP